MKNMRYLLFNNSIIIILSFTNTWKLVHELILIITKRFIK